MSSNSQQGKCRLPRSASAEAKIDFMEKLDKFFTAMGLDANATLAQLDEKTRAMKARFDQQLMASDETVAAKAKQNIDKLEKIHSLLAAHISATEPAAPVAVAEPAVAAEVAAPQAAPVVVPEVAPEADALTAAAPEDTSQTSRLKGLVQKAKAASTDTLSLAKDKSLEWVATALEEIKTLEPFLRKCGFIVGDIKVSMSVTPSVTVVIEQCVDGQDKLVELLENLETLTKGQRVLIKGIQSAYALDQYASKYDYTVGQIEIEQGLTPSVHVHMNSKSSRAFG